MTQDQIVSTPFPYVYSTPHLGNIVQAIKGDVFSKLKNCFLRHNGCGNKSTFCYSFHATGTPVYHRLNQIQNLIRSKLPLTSNVDKLDLLRDLVKYFKSNNLSLLLPYIKKLSDVHTLKGWVDLLSRYYTNLFKQLNIQSNLPKYHTTTKVDVSYSKFVNHLYEKLKVKDKLSLKDNYLISCGGCGNTLGDHDRIRYQGIGLSDVKVFFKKIEEDVWISLSPNPLNWVSNGSIHLEDRLLDWVERKTIDLAEVLIYLPEVNLQRTFTLDFIPSIEPKLDLDPTSLYLTIAGIQCRCKGLAKIVRELTYFVNFDDPIWKKETSEAIKNSNLPLSSKKALLDKLIKLRDVAFLRSKGYGTSLSILKGTSYENYFVDSLMDSALHPYYYSCFLNNSTSFDELIPSYRYEVHCAGKDLLPNHLLYMYLFSTLLYPKVSVPFFDTSRFICAKNKEKMSKSLNNVIYWEDIKGDVDSQTLRFYVCSLADNDQATAYQLDKVISEGKSARKHKKRILQFISEGRLHGSTLSLIQNLLKHMEDNLNKENNNPYRLRFIYHTLLHKVSHLLEVANAAVSDEKYSKLIQELLNVF